MRRIAITLLAAALALTTLGPAAASVGTALSDEPTGVCGPAPASGCEAWRSTGPGRDVNAVDPGPEGLTAAIAGSDLVERVEGIAVDGDNGEQAFVQLLNAQTGVPLCLHQLNRSSTSEHLYDVAIGPDRELVVAVGGIGDRACDPDRGLVLGLDATTGETGFSDVFGSEEGYEGFGR
jgi:hypothetical protein